MEDLWSMGLKGDPREVYRVGEEKTQQDPPHIAWQRYPPHVLHSRAKHLQLFLVYFVIVVVPANLGPKLARMVHMV